VADAALDAAAELGGSPAVLAYGALAASALAAGDAAAAREACEAAAPHMSGFAAIAAMQRLLSASAELASGDLIAAQQLADESASTSTGWYLSVALAIRAQVSIAQSEFDRAERDAHDAIGYCAELNAHLFLPDILECLAIAAAEAGRHQEAVRLFGAAHAVRESTGAARFKVFDALSESSLAQARDALGNAHFDAAWAEGAALSTEEAIAYAQRGRGERKRPATGWASLTPAERDVVRLVSEGLGNNDIAARLFVSPRTVQSHLTHVYAKLGLSSRVQLAQEAARQT
jgi:DNA-binding CsgD family transcriptional regulator